MINVTVTVNEEVARWARIWAAQHDTSVSRLVGDLLRQRMEEELGYQEAMESFLRREAKVLKTSGHYPTRGEIHERGVLCGQ